MPRQWKANHWRREAICALVWVEALGLRWLLESPCMTTPRSITIAFKLLVFFTRNPDEWFTTGDLMAKYDMRNIEVYNGLRGFVKLGLIARSVTPSGEMKKECVYSAGHELVKMIGGVQ